MSQDNVVDHGISENMNKQKIEFNSKQELQDYIQEAITQAKRQTWRTQKQAYRQRKKQANQTEKGPQ